MNVCELSTPSMCKSSFVMASSPVIVTVLVLVVYCIVVQTPNTVAVTVDQTVEVAQLVVVVK